MSTTEVHNSRTLEISMTPFFAPPLCPLRFGWLQRSLFRLALACLLSPIAARAQVSFTGPARSVNIGSQAVGSSSTTVSLPFTIAAGTKVGSIAVLTTGIADRDFAKATKSTCTATTYTTAKNCVVNVGFTPLATGLRLGAVVFYSRSENAGTVLATVPVFGVGTGPQLVFGPGGLQTSLGSKLISPEGVAVDAAGNVFVTDIALQEVFKVTPAGTETTVGSGLDVPEGVAVDGAGNVYITDSQFPGLFKVTPDGVQTTVGHGFSYPSGIAVDGSSNVYVSDPFIPAVFKITPAGKQTTVGGGYNTPDGVAVDAAGNIYITDTGTDSVVEVTPAGVQTTVSSGLNVPDGVAVDGSGNLYVVNSFNKQVVKVDRAAAPSLKFDSTSVGAKSADSPKTMQVENIGNKVLQFSALTYPADFPKGASGKAAECTSNTSLAGASSCALTVDFSPATALGSATSKVLREAVRLTTNSLNVVCALER